MSKKKSTLLSLVDEMEDAQGTDRFRERYKEFVATAADHMTLLIPFLHALT